MTTVAELLAKHQILESVSDSAKRDAELLLCFSLQKNSSYIRAWPDAEVKADIVVQFESLLQRRKEGEPVAYLVGEQGFWTLDLQVSPATLIPRPETELLVEYVLDNFSTESPLKLLDLGTGTGAVALALASERPHWHILGCDIEPAAVDLANKNRNLLMPHAKNIAFIQSDWFDNIEPQLFDLIVSNPPYIDSEDPHLQQGDLKFEPLTALVAANNGMADIEAIVKRVPAFLKAKGSLIFEHGYNQGGIANKLLKNSGFTDVFTCRDLAGLDRISGGQL